MNLVHLLHGPLAYAILFVVLLIEGLGVPSPDEVTLFAAGMAAGRGTLNLPAVVFTGALGALCGAVLSHFIARRVGRPLVLAYGKRLGLTEPRFANMERFFVRHGLWAVFLGRIISGVRLVVGYAAGLFGVPTAPFVVWSLAGAVAWAGLDAGAGFFIGTRWAVVWRTARLHGPLAVSVFVLTALIWLGVRVVRSRNREG